MKNAALTISVLMNIVAIAWFVAPRPKPADPRELAESGQPATSRAKLENSGAKPFSWREIESADYKIYIENIRRIGCPEATVEDIIVADVNAFYLEKAKPILSELTNNVVGFWTGRQPTAPGVLAEMLSRAEAQLKRLDIERLALIPMLLGHALEPTKTGSPPWDYQLKWLKTEDLPFIASEKRGKVRELTAAAKQDLRSLIGAGLSMSPTVARKYDEIQAKLYKDLGAILSASEFESYRLGHSVIAQQLGQKLANIKVADGEFADIFRATMAFADTNGEMSALMGILPTDPTMLADTLQRQREMQQKIHDVLGDERYATYKVNDDPKWGEISAFAQARSLSQDQAAKLYELRTSTEHAVNDAYQTLDLSLDERALRLGSIVRRADDSAKQILGVEGQEAYRKSPAGQWLRLFESTGQLWSPGVKLAPIPDVPPARVHEGARP